MKLEEFWQGAVCANLRIGPPWNTDAMHAWLDWVKRSMGIKSGRQSLSDNKEG